MGISKISKNYFNMFQEVSNCKKNDTKTSLLASVKIFSLFTLVIPLIFGILYLASLNGRVKKKEELNRIDERIEDLSQNILSDLSKSDQSSVYHSINQDRVPNGRPIEPPYRLDTVKEIIDGERLDDNCIQISIKTMYSSEPLYFSVKQEATIADIKKAIATKFGAHNVKVILAGNLLEPVLKISDYNIRNHALLHATYSL